MFSRTSKHAATRKPGRLAFHVGIILIALGAIVFSIGGEVPGFGIIIVGAMIFLDSLLVGRIIRLDPPGRINKGKRVKEEEKEPVLLSR